MTEALERELAALRARAEAALRNSAEFLLEQATAHAPTSSGELEESKFMTWETSGDQARAVVGFAAPHALIQHERLDYPHDDGQAKFLESQIGGAAEHFRRQLQ